MSEPFNLDENETQETTRKSELNLSGSNIWQQVVSLWNAIWSQSLVVGRKGETLIQLPLPIAILFALAFNFAAAMLLIIGIVAGYSVSIVKR